MFKKCGFCTVQLDNTADNLIGCIPVLPLLGHTWRIQPIYLSNVLQFSCPFFAQNKQWANMQPVSKLAVFFTQTQPGNWTSN